MGVCVSVDGFGEFSSNALDVIEDSVFAILLESFDGLCELGIVVAESWLGLLDFHSLVGEFLRELINVEEINKWALFFSLRKRVSTNRRVGNLRLFLLLLKLLESFLLLFGALGAEMRTES